MPKGYHPEKIVAKTSPSDWLNRIESTIPDPDVRLWVASIIFWDFGHHLVEPNPELYVLEFYIQGYRKTHVVSNEELLEALQDVDYPQPERRIWGKNLYSDAEPDEGEAETEETE